MWIRPRQASRVCLRWKCVFFNEVVKLFGRCIYTPAIVRVCVSVWIVYSSLCVFKRICVGKRRCPCIAFKWICAQLFVFQYNSIELNTITTSYNWVFATCLSQNKIVPMCYANNKHSDDVYCVALYCYEVCKTLAVTYNKLQL